MGFLSRVTHGVKHVDVRHRGGLVGHAIETGEYIGASYLAGRVNTQYGERAKFRDVEITYGGGILLKLVAVLGDAFGFGGGLTAHANTVGNAFIGTHFAAVGARHGLEAAAGSSPALLPGKKTMIGAIPPAVTPGRFLDRDEVNSLAAMHG